MIRRLMIMYKKLHLEISTYFQIFFMVAIVAIVEV